MTHTKEDVATWLESISKRPYDIGMYTLLCEELLLRDFYEKFAEIKLSDISTFFAHWRSGHQLETDAARRTLKQIGNPTQDLRAKIISQIGGHENSPMPEAIGPVWVPCYEYRVKGVDESRYWTSKDRLCVLTANEFYWLCPDGDANAYTFPFEYEAVLDFRGLTIEIESDPPCCAVGDFDWDAFEKRCQECAR